MNTLPSFMPSGQNGSEDTSSQENMSRAASDIDRHNVFSTGRMISIVLQPAADTSKKL
jgi:hypothetical protein